MDGPPIRHGGVAFAAGEIPVYAHAISADPVATGVMLVLSGLGFWHLRRVSPAEELFGSSADTPAPALA